jgi:hypothetical protein
VRRIGSGFAGENGSIKVLSFQITARRLVILPVPFRKVISAFVWQPDDMKRRIESGNRPIERIQRLAAKGLPLRSDIDMEGGNVDP